MSVGETPEIDTSRPHPARMWNYWVGGKDYYLIDKEAASPADVDAGDAELTEAGDRITWS